MSANAWVIAGASLYWASIITRFSLLAELIPFGHQLGGALVEGAVICAFVVALWLARFLLQSEGGRAGLAVLSLVAIGAVVSIAALPIGGPLASGATVVCYGCTVAIHMVLWGFCFASMDKRAAGRNVGLTLLATVGMVLVADVAVGAMPGVVVVCAMAAASSVILLSQRVYFSDHRREGRDGMKGLLKGLAPSRISFGFFIGLSLSLPHMLGTRDVSAPLVAIGLLLVICMLVGFARHPARLYFMLSAVLAMGAGIIYLPFFDGGTSSFVDVIAAPIWLAWASLSAIQLSDYKERYGVSEVSVCLVDKLLLAISIVLGSSAGFVLGALGILGTGWLQCFLIAAAAALVFAAVWQTASLVDARKEDEARDALVATRQKRLAALYDALAVEYGLSAREREVMEMLAEGYTSVYIKDSLSISLGTAKAHASHIYQKMGVRKKDELIELLERRLNQA